MSVQKPSGLVDFTPKGVAVESIIVIRCPHTLNDLGVWTGVMELVLEDWDCVLGTPKVSGKPELSTDVDCAFVFPDVAQAYQWTYRLWTGSRRSATVYHYAVRRQGDLHVGQNIGRYLFDPWPKGPRYRMEAQP